MCETIRVCVCEANSVLCYILYKIVAILRQCGERDGTKIVYD